MISTAFPATCFIEKNGTSVPNIQQNSLYSPVSLNNQPENPFIEGRVDGFPNTWYEFRFSSTDPDGDTVPILIDWCDGQTNSTQGASGEIKGPYHCWYTSNDYTIKAKAINEYGAESEWVTSSIHILTSRSINKQFFNFFQHYLNFLKIIIQMLGI